jgi:hypothetical protein
MQLTLLGGASEVGSLSAGNLIVDSLPITGNAVNH